MAYLKPFNWKYSSVFAPALWGLGFGATLSGQYLAAYMFYFIGGVWLLGWWATGHPSPRKREEQTELTKKQLGQLRTRWLGAFSIAFFAVASCLWNYRLKKEHQLDLLYGVLIPAADNAPPTSCDAIAKPADLKLLIGNMTVLAKKLPMVVVAIRIDKDDTIRRDLISIDRNDKGQIVITS